MSISNYSNIAISGITSTHVQLLISGAIVQYLILHFDFYSTLTNFNDNIVVELCLVDSKVQKR